VDQFNKADGMNITSITMLALTDPELLENLIDMSMIDTDSVDDSAVGSVMGFWKSMQESGAADAAEFVKAKVLEMVMFAMLENNPALRDMKTFADHYSLHMNLNLYFIKRKPNKADGHLVSGNKPATPKALLESKLGMGKSNLRKDFIKLVAFVWKRWHLNRMSRMSRMSTVMW
jgi:hypothetical protein